MRAEPFDKLRTALVEAHPFDKLGAPPSTGSGRIKVLGAAAAIVT